MDIKKVDVVVIGAGIAGLAVANVLQRENISCVVLEARERSGGRIHTIESPISQGSSSLVDLGANYIHGCTEDENIQPLFRFAKKLKMLSAVSAGDLCYVHRGWENPEVAMWRDMKGKVIPFSEIADMVFLLDRCLVRLISLYENASSRSPVSWNAKTAVEKALSSSLRLLYNHGKRSSAKLSFRENCIFQSLLSRYMFYVNPADRLPLSYLLLPADSEYYKDAQRGLADFADYPCDSVRSHYIDCMNNKRKCFLDGVPGSKSEVTSTVQRRWEDRLILSGFQTITNRLSDKNSGVSIHYKTVVKCIDWSRPGSVLVQAQNYSSMASDAAHFSHRISRTFYDKSEERSHESRVMYEATYCVITVPVGVLKGLDERSKLSFIPRLPRKKQEAIRRLGIPHVGAETHNKIVLQFAVDDIFWDKDAPQIEPMDPKLHILNLHAYNGSGMLVCHVWAGSGLQLFGRSDKKVVEECLQLLAYSYAMEKVPEPIFFAVTRWSEDPFSMGSYTAGEPESSEMDRHVLARCEPNDEDPVLFFAGEATVTTAEPGQQCTHGAFLSGIAKAKQLSIHHKRKLGHPEPIILNIPEKKFVDYLLLPFNCLENQRVQTQLQCTTSHCSVLTRSLKRKQLVQTEPIDISTSEKRNLKDSKIDNDENTHSSTSTPISTSLTSLDDSGIAPHLPLEVERS